MAAMQSPLSLTDRGAGAVPDRPRLSAGEPSKASRRPGPGLELDLAWCGQRRFKAKPGETLVTPGEGGRVDVVLGLGDASRFGATTAKAAAAFASATGEAKSVALDLTGITGLGIGADQAVEAAIEGLLGRPLPLHAIPRRRSRSARVAHDRR